MIVGNMVHCRWTYWACLDHEVIDAELMRPVVLATSEDEVD